MFMLMGKFCIFESSWYRDQQETGTEREGTDMGGNH